MAKLFCCTGNHYPDESLVVVCDENGDEEFSLLVVNNNAISIRWQDNSNIPITENHKKQIFFSGAMCACHYSYCQWRNDNE